MDLYIKFIAIVNTETGEIENISTVPGGQIPEEGLISGELNKERIYLYTKDWGGFELLQIMEEYYRVEGEWVHRGPRTTKYHEWNSSNNSWEQNWDSFLVDIRKERNKRLSASDWTQAADSALEQSIQASWKSYRTFLRDIPNRYAEPDPLIFSLEQIDWPSTPNGDILEVTVW